MKLAALVLAAGCAVTVSADLSWMPGQVKIAEEFKVPGENPLYFCADPKDDILEIEKVDLSPNPPEPYVCPILGRSSSRLAKRRIEAWRPVSV